MASPFRAFRKHQKTLIAIAGVVLMFVFVVGDSLFSYFGGGRNARASEDHDAKATAVHWDGGKLSNLELRELVQRRQILNKFLRSVEMEGRGPSYQAGVDAPDLRVRPLIGADTPQQQVEESVVQTKLLADAARDAGMKVSDDALLQYLGELGRKNVSPDQMRAMLKNGGGRFSPDYVLQALREEMLAFNYRMSHELGFETVTPQQRWKDWLRVNDHVVVEAAAVPAEMYLADVKEPTDTELAAFFEKYKNDEPSPDVDVVRRYDIELPSATPGFRIPRKIDLQFIEGNYEEHVAQAESKVTDEEVAKYYEEHKDLFPKLNTGVLEEAGQKKDAPKTDAPATKTDAPAAKTDAKDAKPSDAKKPAEPAEKKSETPEKKEAPPASKDGKTDTKSSDAKKSSSQSNPKKSVFRLTAFAEDADKKDAKADKPAEKAAEKSSETPAAKANAGDTKPAPPSDKPAATLSATPPAGTPDAAKPAAATPPVAAPKKPVEYQPLSEVKDVIRKQLAEDKVKGELIKLQGDIYNDLDNAFNKWRYADNPTSDSGKKEMPAPPKSLTDYAAIAQKNGLKSSQTGPKSLLELRDLPIGKTSVDDGRRSLLSLLFIGHDLELYQPAKSGDRDGNRFVSMKVSDTPSRVPTLTEVKPEVIKAWKKQQAAELAQKHADEFAKKAEQAKTPLAAYFADNKSIKVIKTDPFSELTGGEASFAGSRNQQQPFRLSQPSELTAVGPDFLRGVFNLKDGEVGVLPNNDRSIYYVIRVVEHQPNLTELRGAYMSEAFSWTGEDVMNQIHRQEANTLDSDIKASTKLQWDRDPDKAKNEPSDET